jgi:integrase
MSTREEWKLNEVTGVRECVGVRAHAYFKDSTGKVYQHRRLFPTPHYTEADVEAGRATRLRSARRRAQAYDRDVQGQMETGTWRIEEKQAPMLKEVLPPYRESVERLKGNKPSTLAAKDAAFRVHVLPVFGDRPVDTIRRADVDALQTKLLEKKKAKHSTTTLSRKTVKNIIGYLAALLAWAEDQELIDEAPEFTELKLERRVPKTPAPEEVQQILSVEDGRVPMKRLAYFLGPRIGELLAWKWEDIDLVAGTATVRRTLWKGQENSPKGGRERTIPLSESALAVLKELKDARRLLPEVPISDDVRPYVFSNPDGSRLSYAQVAKVLPNACRRAGLAKRYTWHSLRHAFASHLLQRGAGELVLMKLLGHQDLKMVQIYAKPAESNLRAAVQLLDGGAT